MSCMCIFAYLHVCIGICVSVSWSVGVHVAGMAMVIPNMIESGGGRGYGIASVKTM